MADNHRYYLHEVVGGMGGFGILAGLLIGNIHGFINLYRARETPAIELARTQPLNDPDNENPYFPPRIL
jgi:hypothetical protein